MANPQRTIAELGIDTQILESALSELNVGDMITYDALSALIKRDVQREARHVLISARRRQLRNGSLFEPVVNVGIKRLDDIAVVGTGRDTISRIYNLSRRGRRKLSCVRDFDALPNDKKIEHHVRLAQLGVMHKIGSPKESKRLVAAVHETSKPLALRECLEAIKTNL